jgi:hypothetical protein
VCAEFFASQLVVEATLVQGQDSHGKDSPESASVYTMGVDTVLRGKVSGRFHVHQANDSGRTAVDWTPGTKYLLFLNYLPHEKSWQFDGCGNSGPLGDATAALSQIDAIKAAQGGGMIQGMVSQQALTAPISGVHVEAAGDAGDFATNTNPKGEFHLHVPVGRYILHVVSSGLSFKKADLSYEDPSDIVIEPGGCAQVQFVGIASSQ